MVKQAAIALALVLGALTAAQASPSRRGFCEADVLQSEELTWAPINFHLVRTVLRISSPGGQTLQRTVQEMIPWQVPPPRRGERFRYACDTAKTDR